MTKPWMGKYSLKLGSSEKTSRGTPQFPGTLKCICPWHLSNRNGRNSGPVRLLCGKFSKSERLFHLFEGYSKETILSNVGACLVRSPKSGMRLSSLRHLRIVAMRDVWSNGTRSWAEHGTFLHQRGNQIAGTRPPYRSKLKLYSRLNPGSFPSPQGGMAAGGGYGQKEPIGSSKVMMIVFFPTLPDLKSGCYRFA